jgi:hypothetical protein
MRIPARRAWLAALVIVALGVAVVAVAATASSPSGDQASAAPGGGSSGAKAPLASGGPAIGDGVTSDDCNKEMQAGEMGPDVAVSYAPCLPLDDRDKLDDPSRAHVVEPTPGMAGVRPRPFVKSIANDDGTVTIVFWGGVEPCDVLDHVDVAYGADAVTVTLYSGHDPSAGDVACIDIAELKSVTITLDEPLGDRTIEDGTR